MSWSTILSFLVTLVKLKCLHPWTLDKMYIAYTIIFRDTAWLYWVGKSWCPGGATPSHCLFRVVKSSTLPSATHCKYFQGAPSGSQRSDFILGFSTLWLADNRRLPLLQYSSLIGWELACKQINEILSRGIAIFQFVTCRCSHHNLFAPK